MKETIQLRKLMESIDEYDDDDDETWNELSDIKDPYNRLLNILATSFFDKYEGHSEFNHDYDDMVAAFDSGFAIDVNAAPDGFDEENDQHIEALTPQQIEYMVDYMWALEHTSSQSQTHAAPSTLQ